MLKKTTILSVIISFFCLFSLSISASEPQEVEEKVGPATEADHHATANSEDAPVNISQVAFEHILDSHSWHLWGEGHDAVSISLPVILKTDNGIVMFSSGEFHHDTHGTVVVEKNGQRFVNFEEKIYYASEIPNEHGQFIETKMEGNEETVLNASPLDFSITKNVAQLLIAAIVLILLFTSVAKAYKSTGVTTAPRGKQSFLEPLILFVRDDIAKENIGGTKYEKFVPYLLTVFFLILLNNVFGMIPIGANLTGNIAFTFVLSVLTLILTNINANSHYWKHIFLPKPLYLWPILMPLEFVGIFTKPFALMIRLFANMTAGHIIVISLVGLIFVFKTLWISPVAVGFALFIDVLECLVALLQAYIFTLLTALFIGSAAAEHHEEGHGEEHAEAAAAH